MQGRETYHKDNLESSPNLFKTKQNFPSPVLHVSSDIGLLSSPVFAWPCVLLLEGQAEAASWLWSPYSKTVLPLSCDTGVRSKRGLLPVT